MCSNLLLSNWLNSVKANNLNLYESMKNSGSTSKQDEEQKKLMESKGAGDPLNDMSRVPPQVQEQQSMMCLLQQISLYRELLAQVTYQNQLLGRNLGTTGSSSGSNEMPEMLPGDRMMNFRGFVPGKESDSR